MFGQGEWLDFLVERGVMQTGALVVVVDDIPECLLRAVVKSKALSPARCACPVSWLRMSVKAAQRQLPAFRSPIHNRACCAVVISSASAIRVAVQ